MKSDSLEQAAERWRAQKYTRGLDDHLYRHDSKLLADAKAAERDAEPVTEEWLSMMFGPHLASCCWKRHALHIATTKTGLLVGWCPPCGDLPACLCVDHAVLLREPTRGQLLRLLAALGIAPKGVDRG